MFSLTTGPTPAGLAGFAFFAFASAPAVDFSFLEATRLEDSSLVELLCDGAGAGFSSFFFRQLPWPSSQAAPSPWPLEESDVARWSAHRRREALSKRRP